MLAEPFKCGHVCEKPGMDVQVTLHAAMEEDDVRGMYFWLERLAKNPYADDEVRPAVPGEYA